MKKEELFSKIETAIIEGRKSEAEELAREAIKAKLDLTEVIEKGYVPGIQKVGDLWEKGDYFLPELITSAECMKAAMAILQPELDKAHIQAKSKGRVVIGTIEGDIHDIGKTVVAAMLQANGYEVHDLGVEVPATRFIQAAQETGAHIIGLSALLSTTMLYQRDVVELLRNKGLKESYFVIVGGAPVTQAWADQIGADAFARDAVAAVRVLDSRREEWSR